MQFARAVRAFLCVAGAVASLGLLAAVPASAHTAAIKAECVGDEARLTLALTRYDGRQSNWLKVHDNGQVIASKEFRDSYTKTYRAAGTAPHVFTVTVYAWDDPSPSSYQYAYPYAYRYPYPYGGYSPGGYSYPGGYPSPGGYPPRGWSFTKTYTVQPCVTPPAPPAPPAPPVETKTKPVETKPLKPVETTAPAVVTTTPETTTTRATTTTTAPLTFDWPTTRPKAVVVPAASDSELSDTGADVTTPLVLGVLLLTGGIVVLIVLRRRIQG